MAYVHNNQRTCVGGNCGFNPVRNDNFSGQGLKASTMGGRPVATISAKQEVSKKEGLTTTQKCLIGAGVLTAMYATAYGVRRYQGADVNQDIVSGFNAVVTKLSTAYTGSQLEKTVNYVSTSLNGLFTAKNTGSKVSGEGEGSKVSGEGEGSKVSGDGKGSEVSGQGDSPTSAPAQMPEQK